MNTPNTTGVSAREFLEGKGYKTLPADWYSRIEEWRSWYKGKVDSFHAYKQYNGTKWIERERQTLGMAKKVCEDRADLLLNERCSINLDDEKAQAYLDDVLEDSLFWVRGNQLVELMAALGSGAFVEYLDGDHIEIDCVQADLIYPLTWNNGKITECAFASEFNRKEGKYTYVNMHVLNEQGNYVVYNYTFDPSGKEIKLDNGPLPEFDTKSPVPLFQIVKPNAVNNYNTQNPMGMSIFANAIDILKGIDLVYDSYDNEFRLGKKRIFVRDSVMRIHIDTTGTGAGTGVLPIFDDNDTEFYAMEMNDSEDSIKEVNMTLRSDEHEIALQRHLDLLSEKCGFGKGYYKTEADSVQTATGVISQNSQLYRRVKKDELVLEPALIQMTEAVLHLGNDFLHANIPTPKQIEIGFDDSIVEDTDAQSKRGLLEKQAGIISGREYLRRVYDLTDEQAQKIWDEAQEDTAGDAPGDGFTPEGPQQDPHAMPGMTAAPDEGAPAATPPESGD